MFQIRFHRSRLLLAGLGAVALFFVGITATTDPSNASTSIATSSSSSDTQPTDTSVASMYLSNWKNMQALWMAPKLNQTQTASYGPRIAELHYAGDWGVNQIVDYSGFFRDETNGTLYDQGKDFTSSAYLDQSGVLNAQYGTYNGSSTPIQMSRDVVLVPNEPFMVVRYTLTNPSTTTTYSWNVLDQVHLNNTSSTQDVVGSSDSLHRVLYANMTASGQDVVFLGALQNPGSVQIGNDSDCTPTDVSASAWCQFNSSGVLQNNSDLTAQNMDLGIQNKVTIAPQTTQTLYYYMGIASTMADATNDASTAYEQSGSYWYQTTATDYSQWLALGKTVSTSDTGVNTAYQRNLVVIKNAQNPGTSLLPAATNPGSYGYKAWMRDDSFDAMALDASGHYSEAAAYWAWMAENQNSNGTWNTTYDLWSGSNVPFVEPEYDSLGEFLVGVYRHEQDTQDPTFLAKVWPSVQSAANFIQSNIGSNGLGAEDNSIWEQTDQYNTFTEAFYVAGLRAAAHLALAENALSEVDSWNGAASTILSAVQRSYTATPPGEWNDTNGYYDQGVTSGEAADSTIDASSDELIALGDIDASSARAASAISDTELALTHDKWGIARYSGDTYYDTSVYSPAGDEAGSAEPLWPNMTMLVALYEVYTGQLSNAFNRLQWYTASSGVGYMPPGEAVSWVTGQPVVSTMSEPFTAATFVMTALAYTRQYDQRIYPTDANASDNATVSETTNPQSDWSNWRNIPYTSYSAVNTAGTSMSTIARLYAANDNNALYLRIDNASGSLSDYNSTPLFATFVYAQDMQHSSSVPETQTGFYGGHLDHPMNYLFARWSNSNSYSLFTANDSGGWTFTKNLSLQAPQWDPSTGRIEAELPLTALSSSGTTNPGEWTYLDAEISYENSGTWSDSSPAGLHYEVAASGTPTLFGNVLGHEIVSTTTNETRYTPGEPVTITTTIVNPQAVSDTGETLTFSFTHDGSAAAPNQTIAVPQLGFGEVIPIQVTWNPPTTDYEGYLVHEVLADAQGTPLDTANTAVDVSQNWKRYPRYGYVTNFGDNYEQALISSKLNQYHIDGVQFYDWEYKHHVPLAGTTSSPDSSWVNIDNNTNYQHSVQALIAETHDQNALALSYNLIYGAWAGYGQDGSGVNYKWGMWNNTTCTDQASLQLSDPPLATPNLYLFDPGNAGWQQYLFAQEKNAQQVYPFDGWQEDQLGNIGPYYTCSGTPISLANEFNSYLSNASTALGGHLIFNAVGQFGQNQVAQNPSLDALYTECWPDNGQATYEDLQNVIDNNTLWSNGTKSTIIAAYPDQSYASKYSSNGQGVFNMPGVLLEDASIFASGGDHIELGDVNNMLDAPNYLNKNLVMSANLQQAMVSYYNFMTAYEDLLRGGETSSSNTVDILSGQATSANASAGTIWTFGKSGGGRDVLQFINLLDATSDNWMDTNATQPAPTSQTNVQIKYYYTGTSEPSSVDVASPDSMGGQAQSLQFATGTDSKGSYVTFTLPSLAYWDMVWVNF